MKPTSIRIHQPHPTTHIPTHELSARRRRTAASLPVAGKITRPAKTLAPGGRKTADTRFTTHQFLQGVPPVPQS